MRQDALPFSRIAPTTRGNQIEPRIGATGIDTQLMIDFQRCALLRSRPTILTGKVIALQNRPALLRQEIWTLAGNPPEGGQESLRAIRGSHLDYYVTSGVSDAGNESCNGVVTGGAINVRC